MFRILLMLNFLNVVYFTLTAHLDPEQPHFKYTTANLVCDYQPHWTAQLYSLQMNNDAPGLISRNQDTHPPNPEAHQISKLQKFLSLALSRWRYLIHREQQNWSFISHLPSSYPCISSGLNLTGTSYKREIITLWTSEVYFPQESKKL